MCGRPRGLRMKSLFRLMRLGAFLLVLAPASVVATSVDAQTTAFKLSVAEGAARDDALAEFGLLAAVTQRGSQQRSR